MVMFDELTAPACDWLGNAPVDVEMHLPLLLYTYMYQVHVDVVLYTLN